MPYFVKLEHFEGPLDLLLQLIERQELSITDISLSQVTDAYLTTIRTSPVILPEELADFLVVASKLILIKSQILLPDLEVEKEEGISLEEQLRLYREFLEASKKIEKMIGAKRFMFGREKPLFIREAKFSPPPRLTAKILAEAFRKVIKDLEPIFRLPKAAIERAISIEEKMSRIRTMILDKAMVKFGEIVKEAKSKTEIIVNFLALLELMKQRIIDVRQTELFHEITVHKPEIQKNITEQFVTVS